ncbi:MULTISPECIES: hypothetical protein [unclassified Gordonia (in: high G+C Gram-positive bacteria)]|uniref:hypothetical protein n=1 Tax=unclassified Gordonia (in: high G+C Gram-positive bacteria) TaxID=2657482 RepID=UPI0015532EBB|nr:MULTISPECIES: hypothetical protein [unclassified Gordonia (in: high G+C Gram-positive bacteria)]MDF3285200.1 hypothetical protein [Gordonia sp. N1V]
MAVPRVQLSGARPVVRRAISVGGRTSLRDDLMREAVGVLWHSDSPAGVNRGQHIVGGRSA